MMPDREAITPISFGMEKDSTARRTPKIKVKTDEVEVRIVEDATVVYDKHDAVK